MYLGCLCSGAIEHNITEVARGLRPKQAVLDEAVQHFRGDYIAAAGKQGGFVKHSLRPLSMVARYAEGFLRRPPLSAGFRPEMTTQTAC